MNIKISRDKNGGLNIDIPDKMIETNPNGIMPEVTKIANQFLESEKDFVKTRNMLIKDALMSVIDLSIDLISRYPNNSDQKQLELNKED